LDTLVSIKTTSSRDVQAYDFYLRGRQFFHRFRKKDIDFARQMFRQAIDVDPEFALAWAGYADCFSFLKMYAEPDASYCGEANNASEKALELSPELAEAHASRGLAYLVSEEFELAESEFEKAIALNPNLFEAYYYYGRARFHQGDLPLAADYFAKAAEVNPDDYQSRLLRVQILRGLGRMDEALIEAVQSITAVEKHLEWSPDDARALYLGAGSLSLSGQVERAKRWLQRALDIDPDDPVVLYNVACNYAILGEIETALDYLERAIEKGTVSTAWMRNDEDLSSLRSHARFEELLKRLEN
jgi:tetratricopeptide (TPR) repeat protein